MSVRVGFGRFLNILHALSCMFLLTTVAEKEHWSTKQAAFSIAQADDATTSRDLIESFNSPSDLACSQKCLQNDKCRFKIYHVETKKCELLASIYEEDFMDEKAIPFKKEKILTKKDGFCNSASSSGCRESCECVKLWQFGKNGYICDCTKQGVYGSCKEALDRNTGQQAIYSVQPAGEQNEIQVECMSGKNGISLAVFHHDSELLTQVEGYENPGSYVKNFTYEFDLNKIISIIELSRYCEQHIRADCYDSMITTYTWMKGRNGAKLDFWGGGPSNSTGCACGVTNSCADVSKQCNCDINDDKWRVDEGYVKEKRVLPITGIAVGDTGHRIYFERFRYTIGPLYCQL